MQPGSHLVIKLCCTIGLYITFYKVQRMHWHCAHAMYRVCCARYSLESSVLRREQCTPYGGYEIGLMEPSHQKHPSWATHNLASSLLPDGPIELRGPDVPVPLPLHVASHGELGDKAGDGRPLRMKDRIRVCMSLPHVRIQQGFEGFTPTEWCGILHRRHDE